MAFLIEHYAGAFPIWLSPVQVVLIPISDDQVSYVQDLHKQLLSKRIRAEVWSDGSMQKQIRKAEQQKVPYMLIVGQKEASSESVAVRQRGQKDLGVLKITDFIQKITDQISTRAL